MIGIIIAAAAAISSPSPDPRSGSWSQAAMRDLTAIHNTLRDNHPGPVDPENPAFAMELKALLRPAATKARASKSYRDYRLALMSYVNGFRDGHIDVRPIHAPETVTWPGFVIRADSQGKAIVTSATADAGVPEGAVLVACDGSPFRTLMAARIEPYFWNKDIPQDRYQAASALFDTDVAPPPSTCVFSSGQVHLKWRTDAAANYRRAVSSAADAHDGPKLTKAEGFWVLRVPSFSTRSPERKAAMNAFIGQVTAYRAELLASKIVIDVRGNDGGDSSWGERIAAAIWGEDWVTHVEDGFDGTVDWRASPTNAAFLKRVLAGKTRSDPDYAYWREASDSVEAALKAGKPLARQGEGQSTQGAKPSAPPPDPGTGKVYLLTDGECRSACLDFADIVLKLPRVTQVGLPTSADALYIDVNSVDLPSGLMRLNYGMKVYRHRLRGNNKWYDPKIVWPGGAMTDAAVSNWLTALP